MAVARSGNQMSGTSGTPTHCVGLNASCALISSGFHYSPQLKQKWPQLATNICGIMFVVWRRPYSELRSRVFVWLAGLTCRSISGQQFQV
jgi:hypothetical protein